MQLVDNDRDISLTCNANLHSTRDRTHFGPNSGRIPLFQAARRRINALFSVIYAKGAENMMIFTKFGEKLAMNTRRDHLDRLSHL